MISRSETKYFKGIAILLVLFGHCFPPFFPYAEMYVPVKRFLSQTGVELFMVLSGYGVAVSYLQLDAGPCQFLKRRIVKLWPLYLFAMLFYTVFSIVFFNEKITFTDLATNLLWLQVFFGTQNSIYSASHFFSALLTAYLLAAFMLCFRSKHRNLAFILGLILFQVFGLAFYKKFFFADYLFSFSFGMYLATIKQDEPIEAGSLILLTSYLFCMINGYTAIKGAAAVVAWWLFRGLLEKQPR